MAPPHWLRITDPCGRDGRIPAIISFLGYDPASSSSSFPERLAAARRSLGHSQRKLASRLGVDAATVQGWEAGKHRPSAARLHKVMQIIGRL
jgi:DNA-binding XRE family transcriptional regulator